MNVSGGRLLPLFVSANSRRAVPCLSAILLCVALILPAIHASRGTPGEPVSSARIAAASEQTPDQVYQQLRNITISGKAYTVKDFVLQRDAGKFTFRSGTFFLLTPVEGKVTGAVFEGEGMFSLDPPIAIEKRNLMLLTRSAEMVETFSQVVLRFSDGTEDDIAKAGTLVTETVASTAPDDLNQVKTALHKHIQFNLDIRILQDVVGDEAGGFFCAFINGKKYSSKELYVIDPHGVSGRLMGMDVEPEEVAFSTYDEKKFGIWAAFHYTEEYSNGRASGRQRNNRFRVENQKLDTTIDKNGVLTGTAATTIVAFTNGIRVIPLNLYPKLRVHSVTGENQQPLLFIQEKKEEDANFAAILPENLAFGKKYTITTTYAGPDVVMNEGGGNYYPIARESWYPNAYGTGNFANFEMKFITPKDLTMVASGTEISQATENDHAVSEWKSEAPIMLAGFNFGRFKKQDAKLPEQKYTVEAYANTGTPDMLQGLAGHFALGTLNTTAMLKKALGEAQLSVPLYTDFFGPTEFTRLAVTQQTAPNYGQSWPVLVFLPITSFFDATTLHQLGMADSIFFESVGPHEIAHQWWGQTVGWDSYRDQWMSEGFAEFSASLFLQAFYKDAYDKFWAEEHKLLTEKDKEGFRAIDVGSVTLGYRLASSRAGFSIPRYLIYPKGAYILNMVRMMLWSNDTGDANFKSMMHEFTQSFSGRPATTEDFKFAVEGHMNPMINLTGDGKMDWFFNEYVYGTELPAYKFDYAFSNAPDGAIQIHVHLEQSEVSSTFRMPVPIYIELPNGHVFRVGVAPMVGNSAFDKEIVLRGLTEKPKRAMINYFHDVLCN